MNRIKSLIFRKVQNRCRSNSRFLYTLLALMCSIIILKALVVNLSQVYHPTHMKRTPSDRNWNLPAMGRHDLFMRKKERLRGPRPAGYQPRESDIIFDSLPHQFKKSAKRFNPPYYQLKNSIKRFDPDPSHQFKKSAKRLDPEPFHQFIKIAKRLDSPPKELNKTTKGFDSNLHLSKKSAGENESLPYQSKEIDAVDSQSKEDDIEFDSPLNESKKLAQTLDSLEELKGPEIQFSSLPLPDPATLNDTYDNVDLIPCTQPLGPAKDEVEDLMCLPRPDTLPSIKNPCFSVSVPGALGEVQIKCMPYYFLIGVDKCGTTDFAYRLTLHPNIVPNGAAGGKESYYWCWSRYGLTHTYDVPKERFEGYLKIFTDLTAKVFAGTSKWSIDQFIVGDATPMDFWDFRGWSRDPQNRGLDEPKVITPHYLRHMFENPKFILLFRDPVERLYSDYIFLHYGNSSVQFDHDVPVALEMMNSCLRENSTRQCFYSDDMYRRLPMRLHISCYSVFLREWFAVFNRKHFFIARTEDYHDNPHSLLQKAFTFLGVDNLTDEKMDQLVEEEILNQTEEKKEAGTMSDITRSLLEQFYTPCNEDLADLLGDDKFWW